MNRHWRIRNLITCFRYTFLLFFNLIIYEYLAKDLFIGIVIKSLSAPCDKIMKIKFRDMAIKKGRRVFNIEREIKLYSQQKTLKS
jgi:hypothetical protein